MGHFNHAMFVVLGLGIGLGLELGSDRFLSVNPAIEFSVRVGDRVRISFGLGLRLGLELGVVVELGLGLGLTVFVTSRRYRQTNSAQVLKETNRFT